MWIFLALGSAATFGIVSVIDKRLLDRHLPSVPTLYLWIALVLSFYVVIVLAVTGIPLDAPPDRLAMNFISGLGICAGLALMFLTLKLFARPRVWRGMTLALKNHTTLVLMLLGEGILPVLAIVLSLLATRPLFVFAVITILSSAPWHVMEESLSIGALAVKFASILMMILGVGALGLG